MAFITTALLDRFAKGFAEKITGLFLKKTDIADWQRQRQNQRIQQMKSGRTIMYIRQHPGTGISHREEKKGRYCAGGQMGRQSGVRTVIPSMHR